MRIGIGMLAFSGLCALAAAPSARADEEKVPLDKVPPAIMAAVKAKFPRAAVKQAEKEEEDGKTIFELGLVDDGHKMDVGFLANGTLLIVEAEVAEGDVPAPVAQAITRKYPAAKVSLVESVKKGPALKETVDYYEFHLKTADKKSIEVEVDPKGKILKTEDGDEG